MTVNTVAHRPYLQEVEIAVVGRRLFCSTPLPVPNTEIPKGPTRAARWLRAAGSSLAPKRVADKSRPAMGGLAILAAA